MVLAQQGLTLVIRGVEVLVPHGEALEKAQQPWWVLLGDCTLSLHMCLQEVLTQPAQQPCIRHMD